MEVIQQVVTEGWRATVSDQLSIALNDGLWDDGPRRNRYRRPNCGILAEIADTMEAMAKGAHDAVAAMADGGLKLFGRPAYERRIAIAFVRKVPLPLDDQIAEVVRSLRICGILMCATEGIEIVTRCPCFLVLAKGKTKERLKEALAARLDVLAR